MSAGSGMVAIGALFGVVFCNSFGAFVLSRDVGSSADAKPEPTSRAAATRISLTPVGERLQLRLRRKGALSDVSVEVAPATDAAGKVYSSRQQ